MFDWTRIALEALGIGLVLALAAGFAARLPRRWRVLAYTVIMALGLQYLLFGNPLAWKAYLAWLSPEEVGWRQYSVISKQRDQYYPPNAQTPFLAVGSSQTQALYGSYASQHEQLAVFQMAAMAPLDLVLYRHQIERYRPTYILLNLSDFDIAREQPPTSVAMAPRQGLYLLDLWSMIRAQNTDVYDRALVDMAIGEVAPAYKYGFAVRALTDKVLLHMSKTLGREEHPVQQRASVEQRVEWLRESLREEYIAFNMTFLREFLEKTSGSGSQVVIVEGQYSPQVSSAETLELKNRVREQLESLCDDFDHARFVPAATVYEFSEGDYTDLSHVRPEAGYLFAERVVEMLGGATRPTRPMARSGSR